jgi:hypothetical protein
MKLVLPLELNSPSEKPRSREGRVQMSLYNGTQVNCVLHRYFPENEDYDVGVVVYSGKYGTCMGTQTACNLMISIKILISFSY